MATHLHETNACTIYVYPRQTDAELRRRIQAEFNEMPGMHLSGDQAARLFSIDHESCDRVLNLLIGAGFLRRDQFDRYAMAHNDH